MRTLIDISLHLLDYVCRHAGYAYSGPAAAYAYKSIDTTGMCVSRLSIFRDARADPSVRKASAYSSSDPHTMSISMAVH